MRSLARAEPAAIEEEIRQVTRITSYNVCYTKLLRAREVYDVTGAGDTVIGVLGAAFAQNISYNFV